MVNVNVQSLKPDDIVRLTWRDHYRMHDRKPTGKASLAESFGRVIEVSDEGVALFQNRVLNASETGAEECMDGQFILSCDIADVEVLG